MMYKATLILEGGGMRGLYTCGVLDFFIEKNLEIETVIGVSSGATNACNYLSKQKGRGLAINTDYLAGNKYLSIKNFVTTKSAFGMDFLFDEIPNRLNPFDYCSFHNSPSQLYAVSTDIETGQACYRPIINMSTDEPYLKASISLPLLAPIVHIDGRKLLDGGVADSIPIKYAIDRKYHKNIVVLTRDAAYKKEKQTSLPLIRRIYKDYPKLISLLEKRHINYKNAQNHLHMAKRQGKAFIIQPQHPIKISRLEKDKKKLKSLYEEGYRDAKLAYDDIITYLES
ncbi:MAG: patatin family protein [Breznakia sp.]